MNHQKKVAVIGAGIAGLSAAYKLKKAGFEVTVFESSDRVGGRMHTDESENWLFDSGADFLNENYHTLKEYAKELGIRWVGTLEESVHRVIRDGKGYNLILENPLDVMRMKFLSVRARIAFGLWIIKLIIGKKFPSFYNLSEVAKENGEEGNAYDYLTKNVHEDVAIYIADAFVSIMQFHRAKEISANAMQALVQMMVSGNNRFSISYTPMGIDEIPKKLGEKLNMRLSTPVTSVERDGDTIKVTTLNSTGNFDVCILATTADVTKNILKNQNPLLKDLLDSTKYATTITLAFRLPAKLFPSNLHISYVAFAENKVIGGYTNEGRKPGVVPEDNETLMNVYLHEEAAKEFANLSDEEVIRKVRLEISKVFPEASGHDQEIIFHALKRWDKAMPKFTGDHLTRVKLFEEKWQGKEGIYLTGDYMNAPWTEGAALAGKRIARLITENFSK